MVDLAEQHNSDAEPGARNVTTSVTPEAEHVLTGARCRFWFRAGDIRYSFYNSRFFDCSTNFGWVSTGATVFHREARPDLGPSHYQAYARDPGATPGDIARIRAARTEQDSPGETSSEISEPRVWRTSGGNAVSYVVASIGYPGGAPRGTPSRRYQRFYVAAIGEWVLMYGSDGPVHYRPALTEYAETGFRRLLESVEQAGRILAPAGGTPTGAE